MFSPRYTFIKDPIRPTNAKYIIKIGIITVEALTRVTTRYLKAFTPETFIASICSVTRIEPNCAPIFEPILPAEISDVIKGAKALINAIAIKEGSYDTAPNSCKDGRDCLVNTMPVTKPVSVISGNDLMPII